MANSSRTIMTDAGFALETRVRADETKMQFTRAAISTDDHFSDTDDVLAKLTELSNIQQDGKVTAVQVINTTTVYVQVDVNQAESKADYQMRSAALYAKDDDGTEVLYGVTVLQDPVFVHKDADGSYLGFGINTTVGRASNVVVVVDPTNMVTQQAFEGTMKNYYTKAEVDAKFVTDDDFASKLPKNIATTDAANTFAKSQTLAGGATDGKGNAYATMKDVATGLNNGLSTKVTDNKNGTITANNSTYDLSKTGLTPISYWSSGSYNDLPLGTVMADSTLMTDGPDTVHGFTTTTFYSTQWGGRRAQIAIADNTNLMYFRVGEGTGTGTDISWNSWVLLSDDSKVVHSADMRKPASDVAGIEEVNAKQDKIGYTPADDSKVAHLSGANNFDTVPTVNNNPLLLASSLPSDLARTGQDVNFTGKLQKSGQDVATTDDLTIVYAGVPSLSFDGSGNYTITASKNADIAHITDYTLYYRVKGTGDFTQVALTPDNLTGTVDLSKVTTATNFESYATATNVFGESDPSSMVQWSYDPEKASSTPPSLTIADDGTYTITVPTSTPTPIVKYFLYYNVDGQIGATKLDVGTKLTGSLKELITKPDKTTIYDVQATAMNTNAESGVSNSVQFTYVPIDESVYGASWNRKSSPTLTRTDAAVGLTAGINGAQNDFDNAGPWKGMHRVTDSMGNVFVRIPKFYIRKTQTGSPNNGTATWQVSLVSHGDDWYLPKGFWDFTNSKELDYIDIGAYDATGSSSKLTSIAGKSPLVNLSIVNFRSAAKANGTGYHIWDIHAWDMLQVLFIIEFATLNSQSIMKGVDNWSSAVKSGAADSHKGSSGTAGSGSSAMSYRGIENLYGNVWQFCDGVNFQNNQPWVCEDATKYQSDLFATPYVKTSYAVTSIRSNTYIKALGFDSVHPYVQFSTDDSGSDSTYYADSDYHGSGNTILETGGAWVYGADVGLFYSGRYYSSTGAVAYAGCRLLKKALS